MECGGFGRRFGIAREQPRAGGGCRTVVGTRAGWRDGSHVAACARGSSRRARAGSEHPFARMWTLPCPSRLMNF